MTPATMKVNNPRCKTPLPAASRLAAGKFSASLLVPRLSGRNPSALTTMVHVLTRAIAGGCLAGWCLWLAASPVWAQAPRVHYQHAGALPPGAIGSQQLQRGGPLPGYFQPVEVRAPKGARVSLALDGRFSSPQPLPFKAGLLVGQVYRLQVTGIPNHQGAEIYPTVELINRLYPPVGEEFRFPVPIELTQQELEMALDGKFVTRVIYVENPRAALPVAQRPNGEQPFFEVQPGDDPLAVADGLGRPIAILRIGGRLPPEGGPDAHFLYGSPPVLVARSSGLCEEAAGIVETAKE